MSGGKFVRWSKRQLTVLREMWPDPQFTIPDMARRTKHTRSAVATKASVLQLGPRPGTSVLVPVRKEAWNADQAFRAWEGFAESYRRAWDRYPKCAGCGVQIRDGQIVRWVDRRLTHTRCEARRRAS